MTTSTNAGPIRVPEILLFLLATLAPALGFAQAEASQPEEARAASLSSRLDSTNLADDAATHGQNGQAAPVTCGAQHLGQCLKDIGHDQIGIWTSPLRIHARDVLWLVPFAAATGVSLHYDAQALHSLGANPTRIHVSNVISGFGSGYATLGGAGGLYVIGAVTHNDHLAETGRLGLEAIADAYIVGEALKLATNRERPDQGSGRGRFWPHGTRAYSVDSSFPSGHAITAWALARVIASEYPRRPVQIGAYALALAISASRVTSREHFPSDVIVGGTFGYLIGGYVFHHHASANHSSAFLIAPLVDQATGTYGLRVDIAPSQLDLGKVSSKLFGERHRTL